MSRMGSLYQISPQDCDAFIGLTSLADSYQALGTAWADGDPVHNSDGLVPYVLWPAFRGQHGMLGSFFEGDAAYCPDSGGDPSTVLHRPERVEMFVRELNSAETRNALAAHLNTLDNPEKWQKMIDEGLPELIRFYEAAAIEGAGIVVVWEA